MKIHKNRWLRLLAFLLTLCMVLPMVACGEDDEPLENADLKFVSSHGYSVYTVVYSETEATDEVVAAATALRDIMEAVLGCQVAISDDHVSQGMDYAYEILVGKTNRTASTEALASLGADEYTVRVHDHKILILGVDNRATLDAVEYFAQTIFGCTDVASAVSNAQISIDPEFDYRAKRNMELVPNVFLDQAILPLSPYLPTIVHVVEPSASVADAMTLATRQGLAAASGGEQILVRSKNHLLYLDALSAAAPEGYGTTVYETDPSGEPWTLALLLKYYAPRLSGYILCDRNLADPSLNVAVSLAHQLNAVVVTEDNEAVAKTLGLPCVMDARGTDDAWLRASKYFGQLTTKVAVEQSPASIPALIDYAVMSGCYYTHYNGADGYMHAQTFTFLDKGAVVLGGNDALDEYTAVSSLSTINLCVLPARQCCNLSTLSGFAREGRVNAALTPTDESDGGLTESEQNGKHTVCLVLSGGENFDMALNEYTEEKWYGSDIRGSFAMNWGLPALLGELANPMLAYYAATQSTSDEFILQTSGLGYTYPSHWNLAMLGEMVTRLETVMARTGMEYLQIVDSDAFDPRLLFVMAQPEAVKGVFYVDYNNHDRERGRILWAKGTPIVSAAYCLHAGRQDGSLERVAESINSAPTDIYNENSYTFVTIRADSGLSAQGELVHGGDTMAAVEALIGMLDEDVEVVTASEFMNRIKRRLDPAAKESAIQPQSE